MDKRSNFLVDLEVFLFFFLLLPSVLSLGFFLTIFSGLGLGFGKKSEREGIIIFLFLFL